MTCSVLAVAAFGCSGRIGQPNGQDDPDGEDRTQDDGSRDGGGGPLPPTSGGIDGATAYQQLCSTCHGANGEGGGSSPALNAGSPFSTTYSAVARYPDLVRYNDASMPFGAAAQCQGTRPGACAFEVSRFIYEAFLGLTVNDEDVLDDDGNLIVPSSPAPCAGPVYGPQQVKLLSRREIQNTLQALLGITETITDGLPSDFEFAGFSNQKNGVATQAHVQAYFDLALDAAARVRARAFAGIDGLSPACAAGTGDMAACQSALLGGLGRRLFRRPVTSEERADFAQLLALAGGDVQTALELTIAALLNAPGFLYRTEIGAPVNEIINNAESTATGPAVNGRDFATKTPEHFFDDEQGGVLGFGIASSGYIEHPFTFGAAATVTIQARGQAYASQWPRLEVSAAGQVLDTLTIASDTYATYEVTATLAGEHPVRLTFVNDASAPNPSDGDRNVMVAEVSVRSSTTSLADDLTAELADVAPNARVLTGYELATLLSYGITGYPPDDELLSKAASGALVLADEIRAQSARLLATPRARAHVGRFASDWLDAEDVLSIGKSESLFPELDATLRADMLAEVEALFAHVVFNDRPLAELLNADYAVVNSNLASFYGLNSVPDPAEGFVSVPATGDERGGLIRTGAFLTVNAGFTDSSLIQRAVSIRSQILCQEIPPPGDAIVNGGREDSVAEVFAQFTQEQIDALTTREYVELQTSPETCAQCHATMINPLGGGLEGYDAIGRVRATEKGKPVNTVGALIGLSDLFDTTEQAPFTSAAELAAVLAQQPGSSHCLANKALSFVASAVLEGAQRCVVDPLANRLVAGEPLRVLFEDVATLEPVRFRR